MVSDAGLLSAGDDRLARQTEIFLFREFLDFRCCFLEVAHPCYFDSSVYRLRDSPDWQVGLEGLRCPEQRLDENTGQATQGSVSSPASGEHNRFADRGKASNRGTDGRMGNGSTDRGVLQSMAGGGQGGATKDVQGAQPSGQGTEGEVTPEGSQNNYPFDFTSSV